MCAPLPGYTVVPRGVEECEWWFDFEVNAQEVGDGEGKISILAALKRARVEAAKAKEAEGSRMKAVQNLRRQARGTVLPPRAF